MAEQRCTPESLFEMRWVSDPQLAPDGRRVAYVEHWVEELETDGKRRQAYRTAIYLSTGPDETPRRLTYSRSGNDSAPRWSPDGQGLAFLSTRDGDTAQLFVLDLTGGEAQQITRTSDLSEGVAEYDWHPSGQLFCFVSLGHQDEAALRYAERHDEKVYGNRLPFKYDNVGLYDERRAQLYRIGRDGTQHVQLTQLGRKVLSPTWSPDGRHIAFVAQNEQTPETAWISDIFLVDTSGHPPRQLTRSLGPVSYPAWSPDGASIAYLGHDRHLGGATPTKLWLVDIESGESRPLMDRFDGQVGGVPAGDAHLGAHPLRAVRDDQGDITCVAMVHGRSGLYRVDNEGNSVEQLNTSGLSVV